MDRATDAFWLTSNEITIATSAAAAMAPARTSRPPDQNGTDRAAPPSRPFYFFVVDFFFCQRLAKRSSRTVKNTKTKWPSENRAHECRSTGEEEEPRTRNEAMRM